MTAPTITSATVTGGTTTVTGTNLTHYSIPTTASKTFTPTDTPAGELKNGATLIESAIMGGGVSLDGINDYVDLNTWGTNTGTFSWSGWVKPTIQSVNQTIFSVDALAPSNGKSVIIEYNNNAGTSSLRVVLGGTGGTKNIDTNSLTFPINTWGWVYIEWDGVNVNQPKIYFNNVLQTVNVITNNSLSNLHNYPTISVGKDYWSGDRRFLQGEISKIRQQNAVLTPTERQNEYNNTQYYYKSGGAGSLIPITPSSTTATSASFTGLSANDVVYVFNKDGSANESIVSGSLTQFMTIQGATSTIEIPLALYGYKTTIAFNKQSVELSDGTIGTFDSGATYDRYVCEFKLLLKEADADTLSNFYKTTDRANTWTLTPQGDFTPFSPLKGLGPFDVKVLEFKEGGVIVEGAYKRYEYVIKIQNVGVFPAHTIPPQVSEGCLTIGEIENLRYPINGITQKTKYKIGAISKYGKSVELTDWTETADSNQATYDLTLRRGNMGALLDELVNNARFDTISINTYKPFGPINSDLVNAKLLNSKIEIVHEGHERYTTSVDFIKV